MLLTSAEATVRKGIYSYIRIISAEQAYAELNICHMPWFATRLRIPRQGTAMVPRYYISPALTYRFSIDYSGLLPNWESESYQIRSSLRSCTSSPNPHWNGVIWWNYPMTGMGLTKKAGARMTDLLSWLLVGFNHWYKARNQWHRSITLVFSFCRDLIFVPTGDAFYELNNGMRMYRGHPF